jgi:hypothetical protein
MLTVVPPSFPSVSTGAFSPGVKRSGREADHSTSFTAAVKNKWSCTSIPLYLYGVQRDILTFLLDHVIRSEQAVPTKGGGDVGTN